MNKVSRNIDVSLILIFVKLRMACVILPTSIQYYFNYIGTMKYL